MSSSNMDNYRKIEIIGKGSFGCAVLVQSVVDRKYYVMKIIDVSKMDRKQKEEALNEVTFLKAMRHPYIITYRESFMDKNRYLCIVMDYAEGGDMYSKIAKQKKINKGFPENQILDWFVQIALAMKYVHDRKILHRDLKTQNIFLTANGDIKIGDFGIARVLQDTYDCAQTAIGTPYYLSPEICQEKPYNQKSDIWSLGCILYELVTLKHAFDANSMKGLVLKILRGSYPSIPSTYSPELRDLISEMLTRDPAKRPSVKKILEKDFLSVYLSRINALVSNTIVKHELGNTLLKKVTGNAENASPSPSLSTPNQKENPISSQRESLVDRSNVVLNQVSVETRKPTPVTKDNSILKDIDNEKKLTPINALSKKTNNYLPSEPEKQNINPSSSISVSQSNSSFREEPSDKRRSSSTSRREEPEYMKKLEPVKSSIPSQRKYEEEKSSSSVNTSLNISTTSQSQPQKQIPSVSSSSSSSNVKSSPYLSKENKPGMIFPNNSVSQTQLTKEEEEQQQQLNNLINDAKELEKRKLNPGKKDANDDEYFEEEEQHRVRATFLDLDGKEIPGCGDKETISYRIEALRYYLEKQIGEDAFYSAYKYIQTPNGNNDETVLGKIVGKTKIKFITMIYQLIVCEDSYYGDDSQ